MFILDCMHSVLNDYLNVMGLVEDKKKKACSRESGLFCILGYFVYLAHEISIAKADWGLARCTQ